MDTRDKAAEVRAGRYRLSFSEAVDQMVTPGEAKEAARPITQEIHRTKGYSEVLDEIFRPK